MCSFTKNYDAVFMCYGGSCVTEELPNFLDSKRHEFFKKALKPTAKPHLTVMTGNSAIPNSNHAVSY